MVSKFFKKQSKRSSAKRERKISKNVHEFNRKIRRDLKQNPIKKAFTRRKDPGIPRELPFREEVLKEVERVRAHDKVIKRSNRDQIKNSNRLVSMQKDAEKREKEFFDRMQNRLSGDKLRDLLEPRDEKSLSAYAKHVNTVLNDADVILQVIDARNPEGTRCRQIEEQIITNANKKLVLILNKVDLVPKENVVLWLDTLRKELPTVAFKSCVSLPKNSAQAQRQLRSAKATQLHTATKKQIQSAKCIGVDVLKKILGNYSERGAGTGDTTTPKSITVGVVGLPNVGKSSVINSIMRRDCCPTGAVPGVTTAARTVKLDKYIQLIDSPGVIYHSSSADSSTAAVAAVLSHSRKITDDNSELLRDAVATILQRTGRSQLTTLYGLSNEFKNLDEFLVLVAKRFGLLKKGGLIDKHRAARRVVEDWNSSRIAHFIQPPVQSTTEEASSTADSSKKILSKLSAAFNLADVDAEAIKSIETRELEGLSSAVRAERVVQVGDFVGEIDADDDEMDEDDDEEEDEEEDSESEEDGPMQTDE